MQREVAVFKTYILRKEDGTRMIKLILEMYPMHKINLDLDDCDRVLRIEGKNIEPAKIIELLSSNGYQCEVLRD